MWLSRGAQPSEQAASLLRSLGIPMHRPSVSPRKVSATGTAGAAKPKKAVKRAAPRKLSERKVQKKTARRAAKKEAVKA